MKRRVFCTFQFEALHRWDGATDEAWFLKHPHRHMFHVRAEAEVTDDDRQIEFITLKRELMSTVVDIINADAEGVIGWSCERWAGYILTSCPQLVSVEVSEDGENGAVVSL